MILYNFSQKNALYTYIVVFFFFVLSCNLSHAKESTSKIVRHFSLNNATDIIRFDCSSKKNEIWALGLPYDLSQNSNSKNTYSILRIDQNSKIESYNLNLPTGEGITPFLAKTQVRFFQLVDDRYLNIGIKHLDGTIYFVQFDTHHPQKNHTPLQIRLKGDEIASDIFLAHDGFLRLVGFENKLPYVITLGKKGGTIHEKKGFGRRNKGMLVSSALLKNGYTILAFNTKSGAKTGTNSIVILNEQGILLEEKEIQGLVVRILPSGNNSAIIIIAHDNQGKDMEARVLDSQLNPQGHFPVPSFFELFATSGSLLAVNEKTLLSVQINRTPENNSFTQLQVYSNAGSENVSQIKNMAANKQSAYNISAQLQDGKIYVATAIMGVEGKNKGKKTYQINTIRIN